jgi:Zn-dependent peptidase ImmA (M78 family)
LPKSIVTRIDTSDGIYKKARSLKISSEVYLRRMKTLNLISDKIFFELLDEIRSKVTPPSKGFAILSQLQKSINSRGQHLFNTVVEASKYNRISYSSASDILGLKINHFLNL